MAKVIPKAIVTALENKGNGAVPNGQLQTAPRRAARSRRSTTSIVRTIQVGIGSWRCDACGRTGNGGAQLLAHFAETGHRRFSPR